MINRMGRSKKKVIIPNVKFTGIANKGKSVGRDEEGRVIFAENVAPGDIADVLVIRKRSAYMEGRVEQIVHYSEDRVEPFCEHFGVCGGCAWQHLSYEAQIQHKQKIVEDAIKRLAKVPLKEFLPIVPAKETRYYRNKLEFTFSNKRWLTREEINTSISNVENVLGFHRPGAFDK